MGLSRPTIKKFLHKKHPETSKMSEASFNNHIAKAIARGAEKKTFVLPKGPSGKVKLAPSVKKTTAVKTPAAKKPVAAKKAPAKKPAAAKKATTTKKPAAKKPAAKKTATKKVSAGSLCTSAFIR